MIVKYSSLKYLLSKMSDEDLEQEATVLIRTYERELPLIAFAPRVDQPPSAENPMVLIAGTEHV